MAMDHHQRPEKRMRMDDESEILARAAEDDKNNKDWISELPNCILSSIISLLTLNDAAQTSMISRRWRDLWLVARPNLEFDIPNIYGSRHVIHPVTVTNNSFTFGRMMKKYPRQDFVRRVNKFLQLHHGSKVDSFKVAFYFNGEIEFSAALDEWVRFAIAKGVEALDLVLYCCDYVTVNFYVFPHWLLSKTSTTLKHLALTKCVLRPPPDFDGFNHLKTLRLKGVTIEENFMAGIFCVCLLLESLTLIHCRSGSSHLNVSGPLLCLNDLKVLHCDFERIEISAASLVSLEYDGSIKKISFIKTPQLARIDYCPRQVLDDEFSSALTQFASFPELEKLYLNLSDLVNVGLPKSLPTTTFTNLKQLDLVVLIDSRKGDNLLRFLILLIKLTPLLEQLVLTLRGGVDFESNDDNQRELRNLSGLGFRHDDLKKVEIQGFIGHWCEIEFAICILEITTKLEIMVIDPCAKYYHNGEWRKEDVRSWWTRQGRPRRVYVQEKLMQVKTNARIIIL